MRIGRDLPLVASVLKRDGFRCVACGFDLNCAIAVHHCVPRAQGGVDSPSNLTTLCANCHKVVHWLSIGERLDGREAQQVKRLRTPDAYLKVRALAEIIRTHRRDIKQSGNHWTARPDSSSAPTPLAEALSIVAHRNKLNDLNADDMKHVTDIVLKHIPADVRPDCAFRLPSAGHYFGVTVGNIALFRTPAYHDGAKRALNDIWIIWPQYARIRGITARDCENSTDRFSAIRCVLVNLSFDETMLLRNSDWKLFAKACRDAAGASRARPRTSNVLVD
jgi:hypothetical protein